MIFRDRESLTDSINFSTFHLLIIIMDYSIKIQTLLQIEKKKWLLFVGLLALAHFFCLSLMLPHGSSLLSLTPKPENHKVIESSEDLSSLQTWIVDNPPRDSSWSLVQRVKNNTKRYFPDDKDADGMDADDDINFVEDVTLGNANVDVEGEDFGMQSDEPDEHGSVDKKGETDSIRITKGNSGVVLDSENSNTLLIEPVIQKKSEISESEGHVLMGKSLAASSNNGSSVTSKTVKRKMRCDIPPKTVTSINEMEQLLARHRARSRAMRPRWFSERDKEILSAKLKIESAPILKNDRELYAPLYRNVSKFKRSYELMERLLKIYVYKEGEKPIFHQPILKGLYASEGWFMKLMEGNKRFVVKDPRKAHLFYMPFSSRMLEYSLYVRNSHNRTNLRQYLKDYSEKIAAKYRFWNRTGGADHFLVACHDWAPYETRHHMEHCIKALCNADVTTGFKVGRDISLPETYVRSARNPLRDLGGKPASQRDILAFYAGSMHGYLRPILLKYWEHKEPDMKILGRMPPGVASKMNYIYQMKSSKYCICPKGYEVNSPRIVEAIFYECVPVIISDNFVPSFFEVLNWDAFSVIIAEKDVPNLRSILVSIPETKYLDMQLNVQKVQQHFLWHVKPMKYDLFHMTLHSIWHNRVYQFKPR